MTLRTLIWRSLRFHARAHFGVLLGAVVGSAVLIGALVVGDSVRESLRQRALESLGLMAYVLAPSDRFFTEKLVDEMRTPTFTNLLGTRIPGWPSTSGKPASFYWPDPAVTLVLGGMAANENGGARANHVSLIGVAPYEEWDGGGTMFAHFVYYPESEGVPADEVWINEALASQLKVRVGERLVLRVQKPAGLSGESAIANRSDNSFSMRLSLTRIIPTSRGGNLSFRVGVQPIFNAFVNLKQLQHESKLVGRANQLVLGPMRTHDGIEKLNFWGRIPHRIRKFMPSLLQSAKFSDVSSDFAVARASEMLRSAWSLADAEAEVRISEKLQHVTILSRRIFLDRPIVRAALAADTNAQPILTYLVNLLRAGTNTTPYSMVTVAGPPWTPADLRDDEIVVNQWLADDLQVKPGDEISLIYFDPESGARLIEHTNTFRVRAVVPMELPWADRTLMPDFPGIEKAESTHDWDAGFPLVHKIRQKDEDYWKKYRGTPKAFVTLVAGQRMWSNRFGELTAIRFPIPTNAAGVESRLQAATANESAAAPLNPPDRLKAELQTAENFRAAIEEKILATIKPEEVGLRFEPVREQALNAAEQSQDFGRLFFGFSFFLIAAALLLMALLFQLGLEQRTAEVGTLLALGFPPRQVRRLLLLEGCVLAFIGGLIGALAGTVYAKAMLRGLTTIWRDAVGTSALHYHARPTTLMIGLLASTLIAGFTIWLALRKQGQRPARELLEEGAEERFQTGRSRAGVIGAVATAIAAALVVWAVWKGETRAAAIFFSAGALLLIGGLGFCGSWFARQAHRTAAIPRLTISGLGLRGCSRRRKRSLATVALLACGTFLIAAIGVFRLDATLDATKRSSGTGGFALIGESTLPVVQDLNSQPGRDSFGMESDKLAGLEFVAFRVRDGDDASCLNLNRAQRPRLLGVKPEMLAGRFTFAKLAAGLNATNKWLGLVRENLPNGPGTLNSPSTFDAFVPAIGDANSIQWAMGKKVGDTIDYVDERGQTFKVRIVGAVANSILQGSLIIDDAEFVKRFPSEAGYRMFLIDAPIDKGTEVSATLSRALQDVGLELQPTAQKLAAFNAVQNTYLGTFQILGGLGLLLGSAGLGVVVLRNVLERRGELALLLAVGFRARMLQWLVLSEHGALLWLGLGVGVIAAVVAVLPSLLSPGAEIPYLSLALTLAGVLVNGMIWTWLATRFALRGKLLDALRNE